MWQHETPLRPHSWPGVCEETDVTNIKQLTPPPTKLTFLPCIYRYTTTCDAPTEYTKSGNDHFWHTFHHDGKMSSGLRGWGGARPSPFTKSTITYKVVVYALPERAHTLPPFLLYLYMYSADAPFKIFLFTISIEVI